MNLADRIESLKEKHHNLESAIDNEHHRPHPDDLEIAILKKQKLALKDEMAHLNAS
jgi:hypothetical protein